MQVRPLPWLAILPGVAAKSSGFVPGDVHLDTVLSGTLALRLDVPAAE